MADTIQSLGELIGTSEKRDAVHIAVCPVTAGEDLEPGMRVRLEPPGSDTVVASRDGSVGIIDPWLRVGPCKGDRCWLLLHPGTITSLRHEWSHPAFVTRPCAGGEAACSEG